MAASSNNVGVFGSTHSVLGVMDTIKKPEFGIPEVYIRLEKEQSMLSSNQTIPVFDLKSLLCEISRDTELPKLFTACQQWGFFQVVNHGVSYQLLEKLKHEVESFFKLPIKEKTKYQIRAGEVEGYGHAIRCENQKLDWADRLFMVINPIGRRKPHLFPELPSSLREILETYFSEMRKIGIIILGILGKAIGMEIKEVEEIFEDGMQSVRISFYPPCSQPELVVGITSHSDASAITILHQVNGVDGLEIKKGGLWIPMNFLPNAFVVNVGDTMEVISNGVYTSKEHRAVVNREKERISIATFFNPKFDVEIGPLKSLLSRENLPLYKTISMKDYYNEFFSRNLNGKSHLENMKIESFDLVKD